MRPVPRQIQACLLHWYKQEPRKTRFLESERKTEAHLILREVREVRHFRQANLRKLGEVELEAGVRAPALVEHLRMTGDKAHGSLE